VRKEERGDAKETHPTNGREKERESSALQGFQNAKNNKN
tara:strand:- start:1225 stop:1341 length:117 start_codon:yes stop_codon:yes gene_type:complete